MNGDAGSQTRNVPCLKTNLNVAINEKESMQDVSEHAALNKDR